MSKLFTIQSINALNGSRFIFNLKPMPHKEACTMLSKMTKHKERHLSLLAVNGGALCKLK